MRTWLVIPAALLVAVAYVERRRRAEAAGARAPRACELSYTDRLRAEAEAADAVEILWGERWADPPPPAADHPGPAAVERARAETAAVAAPPAPLPAELRDPWVVPEFPPPPRTGRTGIPGTDGRAGEGGRFSFGGWAVQAGHMAVHGVSFGERRDAGVAAADIRLLPDAMVNVSEGGPLVLGDPGFAPDAEGFTLLIAAAGPGAFAVTGRYELTGS